MPQPVGLPLTAVQLLGALLLPADPDRHGAVLEADEGWHFDRHAVPVGVDRVVWGRTALPGRTPRAQALRSAAAREVAIRRLRRHPPSPLRVVAVHRLPPPALHVGASYALRAAVLGGALVEFATTPRCPTVLDAVASAAGAAAGVEGFRPGSGGVGLARVTLGDGSRALIRAAPAGGPGDPVHAADALSVLASAGVPKVPRLLGHGTAAGASWAAESALDGARPRAVSAALFAEVAALVSRWPGVQGPPAALDDDLGAIAAALPDRSDLLAAARARLDRPIASLPAVLRHGDLWAGNLLVRRGALAGVVDWDAWHPSAVPGADLVQLHGTEFRIRMHSSLGQAWLARPWRSGFAEATAGYWRSLGVEPTVAVLDAAAAAWWAAEAAGTLRRLPHRSRDPDWITTNIDLVLRAMTS